MIYPNNRPPVQAQVIGFRDKNTLLMPLGEMIGIEPGSVIESMDEYPTYKVGNALIGRIIDGNGLPIDGKGPISAMTEYPLMGSPINPLERKRLNEPLDIGIRSINGLPSLVVMSLWLKSPDYQLLYANLSKNQRSPEAQDGELFPFHFLILPPVG